MTGAFRAQAELRRSTRGAPWVVVGVWIDGTAFWPLPGEQASTRREIEAGHVGFASLPAVIAPSIQAAVLVSHRHAAAGLMGAVRIPGEAGAPYEPSQAATRGPRPVGLPGLR